MVVSEVCNFLKRFLSFFSCLVFLVFSFVSIPVNAIDYQGDKSAFEGLRFKFSTTSSVPDSVYNYDYWLLTLSPHSYSNITTYKSTLYLISDSSYENFGSTEGVLRVYTDIYPYNTKINSVYTGNPGSPTDYEQSVYYLCPYSSSSSDYTFTFSSSSSFPSSFVSGFVFDNYNFDKFPVYDGSSSNYTSKMIIASNVDIYNQYGELLQYGNYYTLLKYFGGTLDASKIKDWSGHETVPGVVVEPTTDSSSGGTVGDSQTSKDQLETSKGIWGTVKDIFNSIASLPGKIADSISGFFTDLKDGLLEGLKYLFIPSDNLFLDLIDLVKSKFNFIFQIIEITDVLLNYDYSETPPDFNISFDTKWGNFDAQLIDLSVFETYRNFVRGIILATSWYFFIRKLRKRIPDVINGIGSGGVS